MNILLRARMTGKLDGPPRIIPVDFARLNAQEHQSLIESPS